MENNEQSALTISTPLIDFESLYSQAVITMCWRLTRHEIKGRSGMENYRQLIFASVELIPNYMTISQFATDPVLGAERQEKFAGARLFFIRFVVPVRKGVEWYKKALKDGFITLFWDNDKQVQFHPCGVDDFRMVSYPRFPETAYLSDSPIIPKFWNHAQVSHFIPLDPLDELAEFVSHQDVAEWIAEHLCWRLEDNVEFLGSICLIAPNPYYCRSSCRLRSNSKGIGGDVIEFRVDRVPSAAQPLTVVLSERFNGNELGYIQHKSLEGSGPLEFVLRGRADETGYAVFDQTGMIWDMQGFAPFIRSISIEMGVVDKELVFTCKDNQTQRILKYGAVTDISVGEKEKDGRELGLSRKIVALRKRKEHTNYHYVYYRQEGEAERKIRELINSARSSVFVVDPYYLPQTAQLFIEATRSSGVKTEILCTCEGLKRRKDGSDPANELLAIVQNACKRTQGDIEVSVCPKNLLHDRFIIIDESEAWLLGSSINTLGNSLSVIVRMDNPQATIIPTLRKIVNDNQTLKLEDWAANRVNEPSPLRKR